MTTFNKEEFACKLAGKGYTKKDARIITDDFIRTVEEILIAGDAVTFHGFGKFHILHRADKKIYNIAEGCNSDVPAHDAPKFTPGHELRRAVLTGFIKAE